MIANLSSARSCVLVAFPVSSQIVLPRSPIRAGAFKSQQQQPPFTCTNVNAAAAPAAPAAPAANLKRNGKIPRPAGVSPRGNGRTGFGTKRISRGRFSTERYDVSCHVERGVGWACGVESTVVRHD